MLPDSELRGSEGRETRRRVDPERNSKAGDPGGDVVIEAFVRSAGNDGER